MKIENRFLKYVSFDTQSDEHSNTAPSTKKQLQLAKFLEEEMKIIGFEDVELNEFGIVYGRIPGNTEEDEKGDTIGFIAHMDTSPDAPGHDIHSQVIHDYDGSVITLNKEKNMVLDPEKETPLKGMIHHDLVTTDGTTLLGADDKAGITIIMTMAEYLHNHPKFKHNDIVVAFTPDEEIGQGTAHFDIDRFGADYAYTIDGGPIDEINYENFNAYKADVKVEGHSYHTGSAKGKMVNALTVARHFDELLGEHDRPEYTSDYEGFIHLHNVTGDVSHTSLSYIIREHDADKIKKLMSRMSDAAEYLNKQLGEELISITFTKQYENMKPVIEKYPQVVDQVSEAMLDVGITPQSVPIRGGTDGAMLSLRGLPTPNLGTGGYNYHGPYEYASLTDMKKVVELLLAIIRNNTKNVL